MTALVVIAVVSLAVLGVVALNGRLSGSGIHHSVVETAAHGWTVELSGIPDDQGGSQARRSATASRLAEAASTQPLPDTIIDFGGRRGLLRALLSPESTSPRRSENLMRTAPLRLPATQEDVANPRRNRGFTVLLDRSISMIPFAADLNELEATIVTRFPRTGNKVLSFRHHPSKGVGTASENLVPLSPNHLPQPGGIVMIVSDLGVAASEERSEPTEWLEFDRRLRGRGVTPFYLLPYDKDRLSPQLQNLNVLEWDRHLTTRTIRQQHDRWRRAGRHRRARISAAPAGSRR